MPARRTLARLGAVTATAALLAATTAAPAAAHVTIHPTGGTAAGSYTVLTFSMGHGCEGSPTTAIAIDVPDEILSVTPTVVAGWTAEKQMERLTEPVQDSHGNEVTERVATVTYTADRPLPDGYRAAFDVSLQLPDAPDETLVFPVVQSCVEGETGWVETAAEGQDPEELERPAPTVTITAATDDGHGAAEAATTEDAAAAGSEDGAGDGQGAGRTVEVEDDSSVALGLAGLAAGLLGLVVGCMALLRSRGEGAGRS